MSAPAYRKSKSRNNLLSWVMVAVISYVLSMVSNGAYTYISIEDSQSHWCSALEIITQHPLPKPLPGHQAQQENYNFYQSILSVERAFHCAGH